MLHDRNETQGRRPAAPDPRATLDCGLFSFVLRRCCSGAGRSRPSRPRATDEPGSVAKATLFRCDVAQPRYAPERGPATRVE